VVTVSEERFAVLEARTRRLETRMLRAEARIAAAAEHPSSAGARPASGRSRSRAAMAASRSATMPAARTTPAAPPAGPASPSPASRPGLEDLVGGRVLAWLGGLAVLVGLLFLLVIAASRGWIGEELRVLMAGAVSLGLLAAGARLQRRSAGADAALAAAAAGIAGLFATLVVAGPVYDLVPAPVALAAALAVGATATALALRWAAPGIGWLGILGALAAPLSLGAAADGGAIALMLVAYAAAGAVLLWRRWHALAAAAFAVTVPQLAVWILGPAQPAAAAALAALVVFGAVTAAGAAGFEWRARAPRLRPTAHVLLALNALALAALGSLALHVAAADLWLAALAAAHLVAGLLARRSARVTAELALVAAGLGIVLADVAYASVVDGLPLVLGWAAGAAGFSALARRAHGRVDEGVAMAGLGGHLLLALAIALTDIGPAAVAGDDAAAAALAALAACAASAWAAARLVAPHRPELRLVLDGIALAALAVLTATALDGAALTLALAGQAVALGALAARTGGADPPARAERTPRPQPGSTADPLPFPAALAFLTAALGHAVVTLAPPAALVTGLDGIPPAVLGLGAVAGASLALARRAPVPVARAALTAAAAVVALFLASALVVTPFQPGPEAAGLPLADLDVRQQGQALLSALWALTGVLAVVAGLVRDSRALRVGALVLLGATAAKVFLYDLSSLTSLYRVGSCLALGLLLLAGGCAWQRLRPVAGLRA
jgi:uncharacterized membrane protein